MYLDHHTENLVVSSGWTAHDDAELEKAVKTVSASKHIKLPGYEDLHKDLKDGRFTDDISRDFWHCVSMSVSSRDAAACFLRYKTMHGCVARFIAPSRHSLGGGSHHSVDDFIRRRSSHGDAKSRGETTNSRRHSTAR